VGDGGGFFLERIERRGERGERIDFWVVTKVLMNRLHNVC
jgi:exonuclease III